MYSYLLFLHTLLIILYSILIIVLQFPTIHIFFLSRDTDFSEKYVLNNARGRVKEHEQEDWEVIQTIILQNKMETHSKIQKTIHY